MAFRISDWRYHVHVNVLDRMRAEWNSRARKDAHFYVAFKSQNQAEEGFLASAAENMPMFEREFPRLPPAPASERRALEIGCGPGRLMMPMSRHFGELHGVDVAEEMASLARQRLRDVPNAHVHVTSGADLGIFADAYFDFIYSYTVFQHIPSREIVLNYLRESQRVLKPGGVLCCQLRGMPPLDTEMSRETETWTGCYFNAGEIAQFAKEQAFPLVEISGLDTQYMWTTFRKPRAEAAPYEPARVMVKAVTSASGPEPRVPARGREAAVSIWIEGMPDSVSLADCAVWFGEREQPGCYLSPISQNGGGCQMNARLPPGLPPGEYEVLLKVHDQPVPAAQRITVTAAPPWTPRVLLVTDGIDLTAHYRVDSGAAKVVIEDVPRDAPVSFTVGGQPSGWLTRECRDSITSTWEFTFHLAQRTPRGRQPLKARVDGIELPPAEVDVVWRSPVRSFKHR
jgi:SAM-dependent methyltransferase